MYLNQFAEGLGFLDLSGSEEFNSLLQSANDLGIPHSSAVRYGSRNTVVQHQRIHFLEWGDPANPPLVLLHGGNQSSHSWDLVSLHLADRYHVLALDQRGHGDSEWARDADYSADAMAEDALAFIQQHDLVRPIVMGHSMGGRVTLELLSKETDLPRAAVFVDVGPEISGDGVVAIRDFVQSNVEFDDLEAFIERVTEYDPYRTREHITRTARYNLIERSDGKYIAKSDRILHDPEFRSHREKSGQRSIGLDDVRVFDIPALVVRGGNSRVLTEKGAERFAGALPQGQLRTVPDCGHNVHSQNTLGFIEAVDPFLDALM
jgi:esterase